MIADHLTGTGNSDLDLWKTDDTCSSRRAKL